MDHHGLAPGANVDPSHLLWMGADPVAAIGAPAGTIDHVHAKDTRIESRAAVTSRLETIPDDRTDERAWNYVAVGTGHPDGVAFWTGSPPPCAPRATTARCRSRTRTTPSGSASPSHSPSTPSAPHFHDDPATADAPARA